VSQWAISSPKVQPRFSFFFSCYPGKYFLVSCFRWQATWISLPLVSSPCPIATLTNISENIFPSPACSTFPFASFAFPSFSYPWPYIYSSSTVSIVWAPAQSPNTLFDYFATFFSISYYHEYYSLTASIYHRSFYQEKTCTLAFSFLFDFSHIFIFFLPSFFGFSRHFSTVLEKIDWNGKASRI